jgi:hypothetical protein
VMMYVIYIYVVLFCRYTSHVCVIHSTRTNHGDECDSSSTIRASYILDKLFFDEEQIVLAYDMILHMHVHE